MLKNKVNYEAGETPMTDYQFKEYLKEREKREELERKVETIYELLKSCVEAGKPPKEILAAVEDLRKQK